VTTSAMPMLFTPSPELGAVDAIAIAEEVARRRVIGERLADLLRSPCGRRGIGDVEVHDLAAMLQQDHEHVEQTEGRRPHDEEVNGGKVGDVVLEERSPSLRGSGIEDQALRRFQESCFLSQSPELVLDALEPLGDRRGIETLFWGRHDRCDPRPR